MNGLAVDPLDSALVRLRDGRRVLGAGFLIAPGIAATCAHVIGDAAPTADFPLLGSHGHGVEVLERDDERDVAILRVTAPPAGALPVPARVSGEVRDHRFRTIGFPTGHDDGMWVTGRLVGAQGAGRIQMAQDTGHWHIEPGFSGAPVWDDELAGVVGMVVTTTARNAATAHLVPTTALGDAWTTPSRNPYRGLRSFRQEDAELFRGRDDDIERLAGLVAERRLVAVAGPSGSGKSSLVRAGLVPKFKQAGTPVVELGPHDDLPGTDGLLVLDQFEEAVVADPAAARQRLADLAAALRRRPSLRAVLTLRSRSLDELISNDTADDLNRAVWFLEPMSRDQLAAAVEEPAAAIGGLAFEAGLVQRILDDAGDGTLPLVSLVLEQLWEHRHGAWLTHDAYEHLGRVPGALSRHADSALPEPDEHDTPRQAEHKRQRRTKIRHLLVGLTRPDGEGGHARRSGQLAELGEDLQEIARELAAERLLVIEDTRVNLAHQALIDHWPQLRAWLAEDADFLVWQAKVDDLERSGVLLRGAALDEATRWLGRREQDLSQRSASFIRRSLTAESRSRRRWITITAISTTLALVSAALTAVAISNSAELDRTLRATNSALIAQQANLATDADAGTALQLALASWREDPGSSDARGALLTQLATWRGAERVLPPQLVDEVDGIVASADGNVLALIKPGKGVVVWWGLLTPHPTSRTIDEDVAGAITISPDGKWLAAVGEEAGLRVWDLATPDFRPVLLDPGTEYRPPAFSANGRFLTALPLFRGVPVNTPVPVWDLIASRELRSGVVFTGGTDGLHSITEAYPSSDGKELVTFEHRGADGDFRVTPVVRNRQTGADVTTFPPVSGNESALLGNGTHLGTCTAGELTVLDFATGTPQRRVPLPRCTLGVDQTGEHVVSLGEPTAVHWRTGRILHWPELDGDRWDGPGSVITTAPDGTGRVVRLKNESVLTATAATGPAPAQWTESTQLHARSPDGRRWITFAPSQDGNTAGGELVLSDEHGAPLARAPLTPGTTELVFTGSGDRVVAIVGATLRAWRTEGLVPEPGLPLPLPAGRVEADATASRAPHLITAPNGHVLAGEFGMVSTWDMDAARQTGPPLLIDDPGHPTQPIPSGPAIAVRPEHPDQILVRTRDAVALWDLRSGTRVQHFPVESADLSPALPVVSPDGSLVAVADQDSAAVLIDLRSGSIQPRVTGNFTKLVALSEQYLFAEGDDGGRGIEMWDWRTRRQIGSIPLITSAEPRLVDGELVVREPGRRQAIPLDPNAWFRELCRISDREFTEQEAELLPRGASRDRPCS